MTSLKRWASLSAGALLACSTTAGPFGMGLVDGWNAVEIAVLSTLRLSQLPPAPKDPSNAYAPSAAAVRLGQRIFLARRFSSNGTVSCASCHQPDKQFQDGSPRGLGMGTGARRTMPVAGAAYSPFLFWDGRKDSLGAQALGPLEDPAGHGGTRLAYALQWKAHYRPDYEAIFGIMPDFGGLPTEASPLGTPLQQAAWLSMTEKEREDVSRVLANMGKALAAYQRTLQPGESRLDQYIEGIVAHTGQAYGLLSTTEKNGLRIFLGKGQCITCHHGPLLTDHHSPNTGIASRSPGSRIWAGASESQKSAGTNSTAWAVSAMPRPINAKNSISLQGRTVR